MTIKFCGDLTGPVVSHPDIIGVPSRIDLIPAGCVRKKDFENTVSLVQQAAGKDSQLLKGCRPLPMK